MPAIRAMSGCGSIALKVNVIGLAPSSFRSGAGNSSLKAAKLAAQQPHDQDDDQDKPEYPADAVAATPTIVAAAVISDATSEQQDQQDDDQNQFHDGFSLSPVSTTARYVMGTTQEFQKSSGLNGRQRCRPFRFRVGVKLTEY
jgi:hypothetical protein